MATQDVEHLSIWLFAICVSSLVRSLFYFPVHFLVGLLAFYCKTLIFWITGLYQMCLFASVFSRLWLVFSFSWHCRRAVFNFNEGQLINHFFHGALCLWCCVVIFLFPSVETADAVGSAPWRPWSDSFKTLTRAVLRSRCHDLSPALYWQGNKDRSSL